MSVLHQRDFIVILGMIKRISEDKRRLLWLERGMSLIVYARPTFILMYRKTS